VEDKIISEIFVKTGLSPPVGIEDRKFQKFSFKVASDLHWKVKEETNQPSEGGEQNEQQAQRRNRVRQEYEKGVKAKWQNQVSLYIKLTASVMRQIACIRERSR